MMASIKGERKKTFRAKLGTGWRCSECRKRIKVPTYGRSVRAQHEKGILTATPPDPTDSAYPAADRSVVFRINVTVLVSLVAGCCTHFL